MKLSAETVTILKNYAGINSNIVFRPGNVIKTMAEAKNILASATVAEEFPSTPVGIYDLNEFLSAISMFGDPELKFSEDMNSVVIKEGKRSIRYYFSDPQILTSPTKDIKMPEPEVVFDLSSDDLANIKKAAATLSVPDVVFRNNEGSKGITCEVTDLTDATSNSFTLDLDAVQMPDETPFSFVINVNNFKVLPTDYRVSISSKLISHFEGSQSNYWLALEKTSSFGS